MPDECVPRSSSALLPGDVLFNNTNSVELVGETSLVTKELGRAPTVLDRGKR